MTGSSTGAGIVPSACVWQKGKLFQISVLKELPFPMEFYINRKVIKIALYVLSTAKTSSW